MNNANIAIEAKEPSRSWASQFIDNDETPDRETLEQLAALMGADIGEIEAQIAEQERLRKAAYYNSWKDKRKRKEQRHSAVTQFIEVLNFQGKQLFWSLGSQQFVIGVNGHTLFAADMKDALHKLATA